MCVWLRCLLWIAHHDYCTEHRRFVAWPLRTPAHVSRCLCGSLNTKQLQHKQTRQTPADLERLLRTKLGPIFAKRKEALNIEYVTSIRDFDNELPRAASLYNAFRKRKNDDDKNIVIPHSFTFVRRERDSVILIKEFFSTRCQCVESCYSKFKHSVQ